MAIYKITNKLDGKSYIGQTIRENPWMRIKFHFSSYKSNHGYIHHAISKYGKENFSVYILDDTIDTAILNDLEKYYIDFYNCIAPNGYNFTAGGDSGYSQHPEIKLKVRKTFSSRPKTKRSAWNKGLPFSKETREKMSLAKKGKPSHNLGKKMNNPLPILLDNGIIFYNPEEAALYLKVKPNTLIKACTCKKQNRKVKGYSVKYINQNGENI